MQMHAKSLPNTNQNQNDIIHIVEDSMCGFFSIPMTLFRRRFYNRSTSRTMSHAIENEETTVHLPKFPSPRFIIYKLSYLLCPSVL